MSIVVEIPHGCQGPRISRSPELPMCSGCGGPYSNCCVFEIRALPTLVMHGEDDQIVPVKNSAKKSAKLIKGAVEIHYQGLSHGLTATTPTSSTATCSRSANRANGTSRNPLLDSSWVKSRLEGQREREVRRA